MAYSPPPITTIVDDPAFLAELAALLADDAPFTGRYAGLPVAADAVWFVSLAGNDANDGRSWGTAKQTVAAAITTANAQGGGTIYLGGGVHTITAQTDIGARITLRGRGRQTILRRAAGLNATMFRVNGVTGVTVEDLDIDGNIAAGGAGNGILIRNGAIDTMVRNVIARNISSWALQVDGAGTASRHTTIRDFTVRDSRIGVAVSNGAVDTTLENVFVEDPTVNSTFEGGIYLVNCVRVRATDCVVRNGDGHGWWIGGGSLDIRLTSCEGSFCGTAGNDHRGFTLDGVTDIKLVNCDAIGNIECGFFSTSSSSIVKFDACRARDNNTGLRPGGHGFEVLSPKSELTNCTATGTQGNAANEGCGFFLSGEGTTASVLIAHGNASWGIRVFDADDVTVNSPRCSNNNQSAFGAGGIQLNAAALRAGFILSDARCWDDQTVKTQTVGVAVTSNIDWYRVTGDLRGNAVTNIDNGTAGPNAFVDVF